jgi:dynein heavy chain
MVPWDDKVPKFTYTPDGKASSMFVPTVETTRLSYFLDSLLNNRCVASIVKQSVFVIVKQTVFGQVAMGGH